MSALYHDCYEYCDRLATVFRPGLFLRWGDMEFLDRRCKKYDWEEVMVLTRNDCMAKKRGRFFTRDCRRDARIAIT